MTQPPALTVVYPLDPMGPKVGGSVSFIRGLIQHAPAAMRLRFIGVSCDAEQRPPLRWQAAQTSGRAFEFLPILVEPHEDQRRLLPLSLRFVQRLRSSMLADDGAVLVHNRPETLLAAGMGRRRNIVFLHNDVPAQIGAGPSEVLWSRFPRLYYRFESHVFGRADQVYTVSSNTLADCLQRYPDWPDKFGFVPTWVDSERFALADAPKALLRARLAARHPAIAPQAPWLLYVGRLQPQKAPQRLLDAFALLRAHQPQAQAHLIVIGDGNLRAAVEDQVRRLGLQACTHLLGAVPQADLPDYYQAADALLLASDFEGMPMCVLEALACGLPVVSTRVGEVARVVLPGKTGELAAALTADALCQALCTLLARAGARGTTYDPRACAAAVQPYGPRQVLAPVYARIAALAQTGNTATRRTGVVL